MLGRAFQHSVGLWSQVGLVLCKKKTHKTSLVVQWLRLCAPNARDTGSILIRELRSDMSQDMA